jgi:hypothetical protein
VLSAVGTYPPQSQSATHKPGGASTPRATGSGHSTAALQDQIRQKKVQLNDWVTCVSARTPKGKAEIQSLSAQISAAQQQIQQINNNQAATSAGSVDVWV